MSFENILIAFGLTLIAGLSTGIGSLLALITKRSNTRFLSASLGLSAGVMIYVSFMEMIPTALKALQTNFGEKTGQIYLLMAFFGGIALIALIDLLIPKDENPHELHLIEEKEKHPHNLKRTGIMLALAIGIHNFPEGLATFAAALESIDIAIPIVIAIAIHNIPEGIAVSVPIYQATGDKWKAFRYSMLSGLAEPLGALIGILILLPFWSDTINSLLLGIVSGIMVFISFDELLPGAEKYGHHHWSIIGVIAGMALMALSLLILV